ncbi:MAG: single-stranded DNA-binding protein [Oscillospiraceae bacterium]|nr:single-stranded DNA-binding protein [Oscillospiraceae bacterium]
MINNVVLIGRLTADPELKTTAQGTSFCRFSIAVDREFTRQGEERQTDFINIVAWRQNADFISKYFNKGKLIGIQGSIQTGRYTDRDGNTRNSFDVVVNRASFIGPKGDSNNAPVENTFDVSNVSDFSKVPEDDSELPF